MTCPEISFLAKAHYKARIYRRILRVLKTFRPESKFQVVDLAKKARCGENNVRFVLRVLFFHGIVKREKVNGFWLWNGHTVYWVVAREKL